MRLALCPQHLSRCASVCHVWPFREGNGGIVSHGAANMHNNRSKSPEVCMPTPSCTFDFHYILFRPTGSSWVYYVRLRTHLQVSKRVRSTDDPVMVQARRLIGGVQGVASLAQGMQPPCSVQDMTGSFIYKGTPFPASLPA